MLELLASFLAPEQINLVQMISSRTGLIPSGEKERSLCTVYMAQKTNQFSQIMCQIFHKVV